MFERSKHFGMKTVGFLSVGIIVSFVMSLIAGYVQDNSPAQYNVMGVTMPPWFYFVLALNAVVFLFGMGNGLIAIYSVFLESGAVRLNKDDELPEVEQSPVVFTDEAEHAPVPVYDPQLALTR